MARNICGALWATVLAASYLAAVDARAPGSSDLGTVNAPTYPLFIQDSTHEPRSDSAQSAPWGMATTEDTNPYENPPQTNQTRYYDWTVVQSTYSVAGHDRPVLLVNNQFPGPTIEANWGDTIQVTVRNNITDDATDLHWHGMLQKGTPQMDGTPGVSTCPIAPQRTRTYTFQASLYGSSWWHSHYTAQYSAGLFGPMVIHGPVQSSVHYDVDKGPVLLGDWSFRPYRELVEEAVGAGLSGNVKSNISLINGKTDSVYNFQSGQSYRLRLVNVASQSEYVFSIDEHEFTVIAHDYVPVVPYVAKNITLNVAQRADIIVNATGKPNGAYYMRATATNCSSVINKTAVAAIYYEKANQKKQPTSIPVNPDTACRAPDAALGIPAYAMTPPAKPGTVTTLYVAQVTNSTNNPVWIVNNSTFHANYNDPPLLLAAEGNSTNYPRQWNTYNQGSNSSVRIVTYTNDTGPHPMHLHGHNFWVIAQGTGDWNGVPNTPNQNNPVRRDTYTLQGAPTNGKSYLVIEYNQDNPGVWPFHCHIAWHVSAGFYTQMLERPADIEKLSIDQGAYDTCSQYSDWQKQGNIVDEIDSGE